MFALVLTAWTHMPGWHGVRLLLLKKKHLSMPPRLGGCSDREIIFLHILPNIAGPLIVTATLHVSGMMMGLAGLSFRTRGAGTGSGVGSMISEGRYCLQNAPWVALAPECRHGFVMLVFNLFGDQVRDLLDPKMKNNYILGGKKHEKKRWIAAGLAAVTACSVFYQRLR